MYVKSDDQAKVAEERMVFISHCKVPFSVSSTIPYNKYNKTSRSEFNLYTPTLKNVWQLNITARSQFSSQSQIKCLVFINFKCYQENFCE